MLNLVEVYTEQGLLLSLPLFNQDMGYLVKDIEGLDPVDATLGYSEMAGQDDEVEQSAKRVKRNIVLTLGYVPDYVNTSVRSLRSRLYGFFIPKSYVRLRFYSDDMPVVEIQGRVEKMNAPLFTSDPEAKISILCAKSNFYELDQTTVEGVTTSDSAVYLDVPYSGTIETGGLFQLRPNRGIESFTITNQLPGGTQLTQEFAAPLLAGDVLEINSVPLSKSVRLTRGASTSSALFGIAPNSKWLNLYPGVNKLRIRTTGAAVPWSFLYVKKHGGL